VKDRPNGLNRREVLSGAALGLVPLSQGVGSRAEPTVVQQRPPTIIQWLEPVGQMEAARARVIVERWLDGGMKDVLGLPPEARLVQFIDGKWITVCAPACPSYPEYMLRQCSHEEAKLAITVAKNEGWVLIRKLDNQEGTIMTFEREPSV
jgi:hypothetical protein